MRGWHVPAEVLLFGAGGFARETAQAVLALAAATGDVVLAGHLDDDSARWATEVHGVRVLGGAAVLAERPTAKVVLCTGSTRDYDSRRRLVDRLGLPPGRYTTIVHPAASVAGTARIGPGTVLLAGAVVTARADIGAHVAVMPQAVITHDDMVEDFCTIASGVRLGGGVRLCRGAYLGAGALIREGVTVGAGALVGMGAVVTGDVPANAVWVGNPARELVRAATGGPAPGGAAAARCAVPGKRRR